MQHLDRVTGLFVHRKLRREISTHGEANIARKEGGLHSHSIQNLEILLNLSNTTTTGFHQLASLSV